MTKPTTELILATVNKRIEDLKQHNGEFTTIVVLENAAARLQEQAARIDKQSARIEELEGALREADEYLNRRHGIKSIGTLSKLHIYWKLLLKENNNDK